LILAAHDAEISARYRVVRAVQSVGLGRRATAAAERIALAIFDRSLATGTVRANLAQIAALAKTSVRTARRYVRALATGCVLRVLRRSRGLEIRFAEKSARPIVLEDEEDAPDEPAGGGGEEHDLPAPDSSREAAVCAEAAAARQQTAALPPAASTEHAAAGDAATAAAQADDTPAQQPAAEPPAASASWSEAVAALRRSGVALASGIAESCQTRGLAPAEVLAYVHVYESHRDAFGWRSPGVLYARLKRAAPGENPGDLRYWPGPSQQQLAEQRRAAAIQRQVAEAQLRAGDEEHARAEHSKIAALRARLASAPAELQEAWERRIAGLLGESCAATLRRVFGGQWFRCHTALGAALASGLAVC
jgi:hypothetical protein